MLVLGRKKEETIVFPELDITIKVVETGTTHIRIGIEAPKHVKIMRGELIGEDGVVKAAKPKSQPQAAPLLKIGDPLIPIS
jgi:carbon storage regulator